MDTRQLTSPQGEADVRSLRGYDIAGIGGGEFNLQLVLRQRVAPLYWRSDTHTHTLTLTRPPFHPLNGRSFMATWKKQFLPTYLLPLAKTLTFV
jgi:hypothetical protein